MSALSTVEVLRGAKAVLQRNGWHQGWYFPAGTPRGTEPWQGCPVCLLGALDVAAGALPGDSPEVAIAAQFFLGRVLQGRGFESGVGLWNDADGRSLNEVYALLDEAIERAEAGEVR